MLRQKLQEALATSKKDLIFMTEVEDWLDEDLSEHSTKACMNSNVMY